MRYAMAGMGVGVLLLLAMVPASWAGNFLDVSDSGNVGIGTASAGALLDVARPNTTSNTELIDIRANGFTQTISSGLTNARFNQFNQYTISAATAQTVTNGTTLHIAGPPTASGAGPASITTGSALRIGAGAVTNTTNAYGLYVDAPTGATNNYGAVFASGNVGIGTTSPTAPLFVKGPGTGFDVIVGQEASTGDTELRISRTAVNSGDIKIDANRYAVGPGNLLLQPASGNVGIGTTTPAYLLDVAGSAHASSFPTSSDFRLKKNIKPLQGVLSKLEKINGVAFDWNSTYEAMGRSTGHREIGLIAQEVEAVFPELVTTWGEQGYRAIDYGRLAGILVEAIKEQQAEIKELRKEIVALKNR